MITLAAKLFELLGTISLNNSDANAKIDDTAGKVNDFHGKFTDGMQKAATWGLGIATAIATASAAVVKGINNIINNTVQTGDEIDKASQRMGMTYKAYQEWNYVLGQSGMQISSLEIGMKQLVAQMDAAADPNSDASKMFRQLGVAVRDAEGNMRSTEEVFKELVLAMTAMEDGSEKANIANTLFGRSGQDLMPLLNGTSESVVELINQAHELGLIMSDESVSAAVILGDTMDATKQAYASLGREIGESVMPMMQDLYDFLLEKYPVIKEKFVDEFLPAITQVASSFIDIIKWAIDPDGEINIDEAMDGFVDGIVDMIGKLAEKAPALVQALVKLFGSLASHAPELVAALAPLVIEIGKELVIGIIKSLPDIIIAVAGALDEAGRAILESMGLGWMLGGLTEEREKYHENVLLEEQKTAPQKLAGRYANWSDDQKEAAWDYIMMSHGGFDTTAEIEALKNVGIDGDALLTFQAEVAEALESGDYEVGVEDAWFEPQVESSLITQLDQMNLTAGVTAYVDNVGSGVDVDGSHATGLGFVPRDNYIARLHQGEAVLTSREASEWRNENSGGNNAQVATLLNTLIGAVNQIAGNMGFQVVLDSGVLVGQIAPMVDSRLGIITDRKARG